MAGKKSPGLTDAELRLMDVLWKKGSATVSQVVAGLPKRTPLHYSTVLTTLRILETKGYIGHKKTGRAFTYHPLVEREQAREKAVSHLVRRLFGGSPELLMLNLMKRSKIGAAELEQLRKRIEEES